MKGILVKSSWFVKTIPLFKVPCTSDPISFLSNVTVREMSTDDGHKISISGEEGKHEYGVGFLVHKDVVGAVLGCQPVSSRLISIRLRAAPFNITIIQVYAPTSGHDDSEVDHFYQQLQETIDQTPKKDILVVQGDWSAKVGKDAQADWGEVCGPYCNVDTNERGLRLLEFATFNNLVLTNTLGPQTIQKMDMAQPRWETPQTRLFASWRRKEFSWSRHRK